MNFTISRPQKKEKHSPVGKLLSQLPAQLVYTLASMRKNAFEKKTDLGSVCEIPTTGVHIRLDEVN
jgi:hypothetical protein